MYNTDYLPQNTSMEETSELFFTDHCTVLIEDNDITYTDERNDSQIHNSEELWIDESGHLNPPF